MNELEKIAETYYELGLEDGLEKNAGISTGSILTALGIGGTATAAGYLFGRILRHSLARSGHGRGSARSESERAARHNRLYPGKKLPPRGTGLRYR